uniref:Putative ovule protein n=1 Tax=Solanum chacoense TaxID=4108 RepID=A0A0V0GIS8_SOLCH
MLPMTEFCVSIHMDFFLCHAFSVLPCLRIYMSPLTKFCVSYGFCLMSCFLHLTMLVHLCPPLTKFCVLALWVFLMSCLLTSK